MARGTTSLCRETWRQQPWGLSFPKVPAGSRPLGPPPMCGGGIGSRVCFWQAPPLPGPLSLRSEPFPRPSPHPVWRFVYIRDQWPANVYFQREAVCAQGIKGPLDEAAGGRVSQARWRPLPHTLVSRNLDMGDRHWAESTLSAAARETRDSNSDADPLLHPTLPPLTRPLATVALGTRKPLSIIQGGPRGTRACQPPTPVQVPLSKHLPPPLPELLPPARTCQPHHRGRVLGSGRVRHPSPQPHADGVFHADELTAAPTAHAAVLEGHLLPLISVHSAGFPVHNCPFVPPWTGSHHGFPGAVAAWEAGRQPQRLNIPRPAD